MRIFNLTIFNLSGVVTQQVSCDIGLSRLKESILNCILYFTLAVGTAISGALADRFEACVFSSTVQYIAAHSKIDNDAFLYTEKLEINDRYDNLQPLLTSDAIQSHFRR